MRTKNLAAIVSGWLLLAVAASAGAQPVAWSQDVVGRFNGPDLSVPRAGRIASLVQADFAQIQLALRDTATGLPLWTQPLTGFTSGGTSLRVRDVMLDSHGDVIVQTSLQGGTRLAKYAAADGALVWDVVNSNNDEKQDSVLALELDSGDHAVVGGNRCLIFAFDSCLNEGWLERHDPATGAMLWHVRHGRGVSPPLGGDPVKDIAVDANHDIIAAGTYSVAKYAAATGSVLWTIDMSPCCGGASAIAVDGAGDAFVMSHEASLRRLSKLSGASGATLWSAALPLPRYGGMRIVTTTGGDVVVGFDGVTRLYSGSDGSLRWTRGAPGRVGEIALDPDGNVVTARFTAKDGFGFGSGAYLVKQRGADGHILASLPIESGTPGATVAAGVVDGSGIYFGVSIGNEQTRPFGGRLVKIAADVTTLAPAAGFMDFNGDRNGDLLWRDNEGRTALWGMQGLQPVFDGEISAPPVAGLEVAFVGDVDGDGKSDLVWQASSGSIYISYMDGTTVLKSVAYSGNTNGGPAVAMGDVDGDGQADLVLQLADGSVDTWTALGQQIPDVATILGAGSGWRVVHLADFNDDGYADILFRHPDGRHAIWLMNGSTPVAQAQIVNAGDWTATHVTDLDGDGKADIVWQHTDGTIAAWLMNGTSMASGATLIGAGTGWSVTRVSDFDGDGKGDLLFTHNDGRAAIYLMNGLVPKQTTQILNAGSGWTPRLLNDFDGDGKADIVWQHTDGRVAIWLMNGTAMVDGREILGPGTGWSVKGP